MAKEEGVYDKLIVLVVKQAYSPMSKFSHGLNGTWNTYIFGYSSESSRLKSA